MKVDYTNSIVNLTSSLFKHHGVKPFHPTLDVIDQYLKKGYNHVALIVLDGFGENLLEHHKEETRFLQSRKVGTITSVYPSTTTAATTAFLTGQTPYETGYLGWFQFFERESLHYTIFMDEDFYDSDKNIPVGFYEKHFKRENFIETIKKDSLTKAKIFFPSTIDKSGYTSFEDGMKKLSQFQKSSEKTLSYFYCIEPDSTEHVAGVKSKETKAKVKEFNDVLQDLSGQLDEDTLLIVTADHGLTDVTPINLFDYHDLTSTFRHLPANEPRMTNFFIKEGMHEHFINFFDGHFGDHYDLYTKNEFLAKRFLGTGEKSHLIDMCLGDFIAVARGQYFFKLSDKKEFLAHHGGMTDAEMFVPLIVIENKEDRK